MHEILGFLGGLIKFAFVLLIIVGVIALLGYNKLRALSEAIKESWSNIGVVGRKQASLINQLIDVVKGYQESEKLIMLKVSDDMSNAASVAHMYQQSGMVLSSVNGLAEKFPELKANQQYQRLIDSIQSCESQLETARANYNSSVRAYNTARSSMPAVFYASTLGFKAAPYLEFEGNEQVTDIGSIKSFDSGSDGERLNALLGQAGSSLLKVTSKTLEAGKAATMHAIEGGKQLADKAQDAIQDIRSESNRNDSSDGIEKILEACKTCGSSLPENISFCGNCGTKRSV